MTKKSIKSISSVLRIKERMKDQSRKKWSKKNSITNIKAVGAPLHLQSFPTLSFYIFLLHRDDDKIILFNIDWSQLPYDKSSSANDCIIARYMHDPEEDQFCYKVYHFLCDEKSVDATYNCLNHLLGAIADQFKTERRKLSQVYIATDGGPADFKCAQFQEALHMLSSNYGVTIDHIVLAPYHGWGVCDGAKATAFRNIRKEVRDRSAIFKKPDDLLPVISQTANYFAATQPARDVVPVPAKGYKDISKYFHFRHRGEKSIIKGWLLSSEGAREDTQWRVG